MTGNFDEKLTWLRCIGIDHHCNMLFIFCTYGMSSFLDKPRARLHQRIMWTGKISRLPCKELCLCPFSKGNNTRINPDEEIRGPKYRPKVQE
jgi:hypothetical protein